MHYPFLLLRYIITSKKKSFNKSTRPVGAMVARSPPKAEAVGSSPTSVAFFFVLFLLTSLEPFPWLNFFVQGKGKIHSGWGGDRWGGCGVSQA